MKDKQDTIQKSENKNIRQVVLFWLLIISFSSCALLTLYIVQIQYRNFQLEAQSFKEKYIEEQKNILKQKVDEAVTYVDYRRKKTNERLTKDIKARVNEAWDVTDHLYKSFHNVFTEEKISYLIKEALRPIRFNQGRGYYFIVSLDGTEELYPTRPELEGKNLIDLQDIAGKFVIRNEIETVQKYGEGFVTGYWPNPLIENDSGSLQYSFVKLFKPLNWLVGTGDYLNNVEKDIKAETLEWLSKIRFGQNSYIFADTYLGDALLMDGQIVEEEINVWELEDPHGIKVIQEETRIAKTNPEGGFLEYFWRKEDGIKPVPVISFVKAVEEWEWVLGSSIYVDDIEKYITTQEGIRKKNVNKDILKILLGFFLSIPFFTLVSLLISRRFNSEIEVFFSFFKNADEIGTEVELTNLKLKEFHDLGKATNRMIAKRREAEEKLELLSRSDPLTGLSNRRDMIEKINYEIKRADRTGEVFSFILIDIDHFKKVNDSFGHDTGDALLIELSGFLKGVLRQSDTIARWGGEEFLLLLPNFDTTGAFSAAEKFRKMVQEKDFVVADQKINITLTLGVSTWREGLSYEKAITKADSALYKGKELGRNRVVRLEED